METPKELNLRTYNRRSLPGAKPPRGIPLVSAANTTSTAATSEAFGGTTVIAVPFTVGGAVEPCTLRLDVNANRPSGAEAGMATSIVLNDIPVDAEYVTVPVPALKRPGPVN